MNTIYTWGYGGSTPADLTAFQQATRALVCDVRLSPRSQVPRWQGYALRQLLGADYLAVPALGNRNYRTGGPVALDNPMAALHQLEPKLAGRPILLVCACEDQASCHRTVAANFLAAETGAQVEHLPTRFVDWPGSGLVAAGDTPAPRGSMAHQEGALRAISLTQPWASLIGAGKLVETRSWATTHRGELAIHAAKGFPGWAIAECFEKPFSTALRAIGVTKPAELPRGAIVAVCRIVDCRRTTDPDVLTTWAPTGSVERAFGNYETGRFALRLGDVQRLAAPVPVRGYLNLWDVPADVEELVRRQLREQRTERVSA